MSIITSVLVFGGVVQVAISAMSLAQIIEHALLFQLVPTAFTCTLLYAYWYRPLACNMILSLR